MITYWPTETVQFSLSSHLLQLNHRSKHSWWKRATDTCPRSWNWSTNSSYVCKRRFRSEKSNWTPSFSIYASTASAQSTRRARDLSASLTGTSLCNWLRSRVYSSYTFWRTRKWWAPLTSYFTRARSLKGVWISTKWSDIGQRARCMSVWLWSIVWPMKNFWWRKLRATCQKKSSCR